ncbi:MAG: class I mannose-6-phosphate isomerase [Simkania sp.]|nr:class I mannose-6-phosphate isomerase [Simkania sp.]
METFYPLYFQPVYKSYIWGGKDIVSDFHRTEAPEQVAESWEISDRQDGMSVVANGIWQGLTLHELLEKLGEGLVGKGRRFSAFPLLIKLIDSHEHLSIQVHPDDVKARLLGAEPKTEMWYVLKADKQAAVYAGLKPNIDREAFKKVIETGTVLDVLEKIAVKSGDVIFVPGGTVHAILTGCLLLEVQQNSNTTYRIYDWGRVEKDGTARPLHISEALQAIDWVHRPSPKSVPVLLHKDKTLHIERLLKTAYFEMQYVETIETWEPMVNEESFQVFFALEGEAELTTQGGMETMILGRTYLVPAACKKVKIIPKTTSVRILRVTL